MRSISAPSFATLLGVVSFSTLHVQAQLVGTDAAPAMGLWRQPSAYPVPYEVAEPAEIKAAIDRILAYLEQASPVRVVDLDTKEPVLDGAPWPKQPGLERGPFDLVSYEWGVTYAGMLEAADATDDERYADFVSKRLGALARFDEVYGDMPADERPRRYPTRGLREPRSLDQCGAMSAAFIKAERAGVAPGLDRLWVSGLRYISEGQSRLSDRTLSRDRPMPNSLWLDDLYMSVPALAQMGALTGEQRYFDDAVRQMDQFAKRMFIPETGLYRHGWVMAMDPHPYLPWARANGWAFMANAELLSVLPQGHSGYDSMLDLFRKQAAGLAATQGIDGLWHQLLDRPATYEETSASAMFVFGFARGINRGWLDPLAYGPVASLGWNAVATKINAEGQVEGTCVGTGMGWDPAFYAYRATSVYAAHGYGPALLAGAEMVRLRQEKGAKARVHDGAVHFGETPNW